MTDLVAGLGPLVRLRRTFSHPVEAAAADSVPRELKRLDLAAPPRTRATVAIAVGSRAPSELPAIVREAVAWLAARGWKPFVLPAMGSHGGGTDEGQLATLRKLGVAENLVGCELRAARGWRDLGPTTLGFPGHVAEEALGADAVLVVNRVKSHTAFVGTIGSGIVKMLAIGLGGPPAAEAVHGAGLEMGLEKAIRASARLVASRVKFAGGLAMVENGAGGLARLAAVAPDSLEATDEALYAQAVSLAAGLPVDDIDVLIVDRMGKDISGTGMDPWVIGRLMATGEPEPERPRVRRIYVRGLSPASGGNAHGVGLADMVHARLAGAIDWPTTRLNALTARAPQKSRLPLVFASDHEAIEAALLTAGSGSGRARLVRLADTRSLGELWLSEPALAEALKAEGTREMERRALGFDAAGDLVW